MADPSNNDIGPTPVTIFGRTYHLRGDGDPKDLADLAALVDGKMKEVARSTGTGDTLRVAIMAALNIADDYVRARRGMDSEQARDAEMRLARMVTLLDEALAG